MAAKYILGVLSLVFLVAGAISIARHAGRANAQARTWLLIAVVFGAVTVWLLLQG